MAERQEHWPGCEHEHHACALARLEEARVRVTELERKYAQLLEGLDAMPQLLQGYAALGQNAAEIEARVRAALSKERGDG